MAPEVGKAGTNFTQVSPEHRKKINAIVKFYRKKKHPFAACVRDNRRRFGDRTEQVCAVVKDMAMGTTKWRKGGGHKNLSAPRERTFDLSAIDVPQVTRDLVRLADEVIAAERNVIDLASPEAVERLSDGRIR
jgi:hypothetical protein